MVFSLFLAQLKISRLGIPDNRLRGLDNEDLESSGEDVKQLEEFLKRSGFSSHSSDGDTTGSDHDADIKLRSCVRRFLALKMNQDMAKMIDMADSQKKTVSFAVNGKPRYLDEKVLGIFFFLRVGKVLT